MNINCQQQRVTFSDIITTYIVPSIDDDDNDAKEKLFYSRADIRRFQIFDQYHKEKALLQGLTKMLQRSNNESCNITIGDFQKLTISDAQALVAGVEPSIRRA